MNVNEIHFPDIERKLGLQKVFFFSVQSISTKLKNVARSTEKFLRYRCFGNSNKKLQITDSVFA
jgi:hypothetical protein